MLVLQKVLYKCKSVDEAVSIIKTLPNTNVGAVYYIGDAKKLVRFEFSNKHREYDNIVNDVRGNTNIPTAHPIKQLISLRTMKIIEI